jgi:nucleotide-binding universal stress UspA family protein
MQGKRAMSIKTILVPAGGSESDRSIFETALAAAAPLAAHLDFYHVTVDACEAAENTPHVGFAMGAGLVNTLTELRIEEQGRLSAARDQVEIFCRQHGIAIREKPQDHNAISASWCEECGDSRSLIMRRARCSDLIIMGRSHHCNHLPENLLERLLLESGRPILLAPAEATRALDGTVMVCWKDCREAAHAVTAAMPLLRRAVRVVIANVAEGGDDGGLASADRLARQMLWHGVHAATCHVASDRRRTVADALSSKARELEAGVMVMGAYSRSRISELLFGGCTKSFLRAADCAVFLAH